MRGLADVDQIRRFMTALGGIRGGEARLYFTGGATAVLLGWCPSTIDIDILDVSDVEEMFRRRLIESEQLKILFDAITPQLYRYPAIDPRAFQRAVEKAVEAFERSQHE